MTKPAVQRVSINILPGLLLCLLSVQLQAQTGAIVTLDSGRDCSIRGMSIPQAGVIWISGSKGQIARSTDGGRSWGWQAVAGFGSTDFRDIHAFDSLRAIIMGIGNPAYILKTMDGGRSWKTVFVKSAPGMFLDAMDFRGREGICIGDPLESEAGRSFYVIRTHDGGDTWQEDAPGRRPAADSGEAIFSASGSNIALLRGGRYAFISGGMRSQLYQVDAGRKTKFYTIPIVSGSESSGAFSMATDRKRRFYCVGGDYRNPAADSSLFAWTADRGRSWKQPRGTGPSGYRSCVQLFPGGRLIACGTNGVDIAGRPDSWTRVSGEGFNVCTPSPDGRRVYFAGAKGRIGVLER